MTKWSAALIEKSKAVIYGTHSIVGLRSLDDCVRLNGNPRKILECTERERWRPARLQVGPDRKLAFLLPLRGQDSSASIHLDEVESQVIQRGPQLIDKFSCVQGDHRAGFKEIQCFFTIRYCSESITVCGGI
jgi:hypothetical protein